MKNLFPGHYKKSKSEFKELWESAVFAFDTNVLLDFFRYSDDTVEDLMATIEKVKDRIWLPFQVAAEYHKLLYGIIGEQAGHYATAIKDLSALRATLDAKRKHPFVSKEVYNKADEAFKALEKELKEKQEKVISLLNENPIKEKLAILFNNKLGDPFDEKEMATLCAEGELRYAKLIPPGYEDAKKPSPDKFGDLIIWKQLLKYAKESSKAIIFITGDTKSDWFLSESGKTIGPRPELLAEFLKEAGQNFYSYPTTTFLKSANEFLSAGVKKTTLDEVKSFDESLSKNRSDIEKIRSRLRKDLYYRESSIGVDQTRITPDSQNIQLGASRELLENHIRTLRNSLNHAKEIQNLKPGLSLTTKQFLVPFMDEQFYNGLTTPQIIEAAMELIHENTTPTLSEFWLFIIKLYSSGDIPKDVFDELFALRK